MSDDIYQVIEDNAASREQEEARSGSTAKASDRPFDKEEWAANKKAEREHAFEMVETATERITQEPKAFYDYLDIMARFERLSVPNTLLIFEQMPEATRLGDFDFWKNMGESVKKGATGITILVPGDEYTRDDGSVGVSFNTKREFDESQTTARHREPRHPNIHNAMLAFIEKSPVKIIAVESFENPSIDSYYDHDNRTVFIKKELPPQELFKALVKGLAHATLAEQDSVYDYEANKDTATTAAYVVAKRYGIDTTGLTATPPTLSEDGSLQLVREELSRIRNTAKTISDSFGKTLEANKSQESSHKQPQAHRGGRDER